MKRTVIALIVMLLMAVTLVQVLRSPPPAPAVSDSAGVAAAEQAPQPAPSRTASRDSNMQLASTAKPVAMLSPPSDSELLDAIPETDFLQRLDDALLTDMELQEMQQSATEGEAQAIYHWLRQLSACLPATGRSQRAGMRRLCRTSNALAGLNGPAAILARHRALFLQLETAALDGDDHARFRYPDALQDIYRFGILNPHDEEAYRNRTSRAVGWQMERARQGDAAAAAHLQQIYANGQGVRRNLLLAAMFERRALELQPVGSSIEARVFREAMTELDLNDLELDFRLEQLYSSYFL